MILAFENELLSFYKDGIEIAAAIKTPYQEADLFSVRYIQSADIVWLTHRDYAPMQLMHYADDDWELVDFNFKNGPFMKPNSNEALKIATDKTDGTVKLVATGNLFQSGHVNSLWQVSHWIDTVVKTVTATPTKLIWLVKFGNCKTSWAAKTEVAKGCKVNITPGVKYAEAQNAGTTGDTEPAWPDIGQTVEEGTLGTYETEPVRMKGATWKVTTHDKWTGTMTVQRSLDNGATWKVLRQYTSKDDFNVTTDDTEDDDCLIKACAAITAGSCQIELTVLGYNLSGVVKITAVTDSKNATGTVLSWLGTTEPTDIWAEGSWSDVNGYPACCNFYQDRFVFGGTYAEPQTEWYSVTGDYNNFARHTPLQSDDGITIPLLARQINTIRSMIGLSGMVTLTNSAEWTIGYGVDVMTPTNTGGARADSYYGCADVAPVVVGSRILFVQDVGCALRDMGYTYEAQGYAGNNISLLANNLFRGYEITQMSYAQEPDSVVWCIRDDGALLGLTYMRDQDVWGWHRHDTQGKFESVCAIPGKAQSEVYFVVNRDGQRYIERLAYRLTDDNPVNCFFVDCGLSIINAVPVTSINIPHLAGKTVAVLADGNVLTQRMVAVDGTVVLDIPAKVVQVGLPYVSRVETLDIEIQTNDGTVLGRKKKLSEITLRLEQSRDAWVATASGVFTELKMRSNENWNEPIRLFTGDRKQTVIGSYDTAGRVIVEQRDPVPLTILAIIPRFTMGG